VNTALRVARICAVFLIFAFYAFSAGMMVAVFAKRFGADEFTQGVWFCAGGVLLPNILFKIIGAKIADEERA